MPFAVPMASGMLQICGRDDEFQRGRITFGPALTKLGLPEFLDWKDQLPERHERRRSEVFAMLDAWRVHRLIALHIAALLMTQLKGSPCRVFAEGQGRRQHHLGPRRFRHLRCR